LPENNLPSYQLVGWIFTSPREEKSTPMRRAGRHAAGEIEEDHAAMVLKSRNRGSRINYDSI
jgi:hypothetical protein